jgi:4-hydroxy-2-oxoheptanedioate aldolase
MIKPHRYRERLADGHPVFGLLINFDSPWLVDVAGLIGFDFVLIDAEHGPLSPARAEGMIRAAEAAGISAIVRVPANVPHEILRYLDIGAVGIQVPHLDTAKETRAAADALRYPPMGTRGLAALTRAANYGMSVSPKEYMEIANREVVFLAMIETMSAVENIDAIAAVSGVDALAVGAGDLSASMGHGGDRTVPPVKDAITRVLAAAKAHGRPVSLPAVNQVQAKECLELGAKIVVFPATNLVVDQGRGLLRSLTG